MKKIPFLLVVILTLFISRNVFSQLPPGDTLPNLAYDNHRNLFLNVYSDRNDAPPEFFVRAQLVNPDATLSGSEFSPSTATDTGMNDISYDSINQIYLVIWQEGGIANPDIMGQLINNDGSLEGSNFNVSSPAAGDQVCPALAFDSANERFLAVWNDNRTGTTHIYGQLINSDGSPEGSNFIIFDAAEVDIDFCPDVAYDSTNNRLLVVWADVSSGALLDVFGQLVNSNGSLSGTSFAISGPAADDIQRQPRAAFDNLNNRYLVVWEDGRNDPANDDIYAQLLNADGSLSGSNFPISTADNSQRSPTLVFDSAAKNYLVLWSDLRDGVDSYIFGQYVKDDGTLDGGNFQVSTETNEVNVPAAIAYNAFCENYLVCYATLVDLTLPSERSELRYLVVGDPCAPTVTSTSPEDGAVSVPVNTAVTATFNRPMLESTINTDNFFLDNSVTGAVTYDDATRTATFTPSKNLAGGTVYTVTITTDVKNAFGENMQEQFTWTFTTKSAGGCSLIVNQ